MANPVRVDKQRGKFTNGTVKKSVIVRRDDSTNKIINSFPCFIKKDGVSADGMGSATVQLLKSDMDGDRQFYGIVDGVNAYRGSSEQTQRVDVILRGVYDAPQDWLWTPEYFQVEKVSPVMKDAVTAHEGEVAGTDGTTLKSARGGGDTLFPYVANCGMVMYDAEKKYPFCVSRYVCMMIMLSEMSGVKLDGGNKKARRYYVLGQFFGHVTDWNSILSGTTITKTVDAHKKDTRGEGYVLTNMSGRKLRNRRRRFKVFLRC